MPHDGLICTGETCRSVAKLTFARGAGPKDPSRLFNANLDGNVRRAIDLHESDDMDAEMPPDIGQATRPATANRMPAVTSGTTHVAPL